MPVLLVLVLVLAGGLLLAGVLLPLSLVFRFRAGSRRRRALGWAASLNLFAAALSSSLLLLTAAISTVWIPKAFQYTLVGAATGFALGFLGLALSRWETTAQGLYYTPSRWLILLITLIVITRIGYGFWRAWHAWQTTPGGESWLAASGAAGSMGAGATILGYSLIYWAGVRRKAARHRLLQH